MVSKMHKKIFIRFRIILLLMEAGIISINSVKIMSLAVSMKRATVHSVDFVTNNRQLRTNSRN